MSVSKLTWVMSPLQFIDSGQLNLGGWLSALTTLITNNSQYWAVNFERTTAPRCVELKRKGTVSGDLATARILVFGGTAPHANALETPSTAYTTALYIACCPTANTGPTGPAVNYDVGDPYNGSLSVKAMNIYSSTIPATNVGAALYIIESEEAIFLIFRSSVTSQIASAFAGKLWTAGGATQDDIAYWMAGSSNNVHISPPVGFTSASMVPGCYPPSTSFYSTAVAIAGAFKYEIGRVFDAPSVQSAASGGSALSDNGYLTTIAVFHVILLAARVRGSSGNFVYAGKLRQVRYGPSLIDRATTYDNGVQQSYFVGSSQVAIGFGYHFDQFQ
jgi:hypothetical protein